MQIYCVPLRVREYVDHCVGCDNIVPFDSNGHCWICGCDMPFGSIDDDTLTQEMFEAENRKEWFEIKVSDKPIFKTPTAGRMR